LTGIVTAKRTVKLIFDPSISKENRKTNVCNPLPFEDGAAVVGREFLTQIKCEKRLRKKRDGVPFCFLFLGHALGAAEMGMVSPPLIDVRNC
jgi:hypothetical protein